MKAGHGNDRAEDTSLFEFGRGELLALSGKIVYFA
jgi:hypothetical protein